MKWLKSERGRAISIHALREEGDFLQVSVSWFVTDFYPRPPRGGRHSFQNPGVPPYEFLSTPSARRATAQSSRKQAAWFNFYPRPPRGGRLVGYQHMEQLIQFLSTPSARRATQQQQGQRQGLQISIHALREEGDVAGELSGEWTSKFLSTPSARRATSCARHVCMRNLNFYPRPPRGGRPLHSLCLLTLTKISIHALREEGDPQVTAPKGGWAISIHALREEGDKYAQGGYVTQNDFYPRPPRGGRHTHQVDVACVMHFYPRPPRGGRPVLANIGEQAILFLSTPSARRATRKKAKATEIEVISIHALREEGDQTTSPCDLLWVNFYPRPPRGGRQQKQRQNLYFQTNYTTFCTNLEEL